MKKTVLFLAALALLTVGSTVDLFEAQAGERKSIKPPKDHPLEELISGYEFMTKETKAIYDDDFENPGFIWVDQGEELWSTVDGSAGKSCQSCHDDASASMLKAGTTFPKWNAKLKKAVSLEQQINVCRTDNMKAKAWKWESGPLLAMTTYVRHQSRGEPVMVETGGPMAPVIAKGKELYYTRVGQLDMACANCHEDNYGNNARANLLTQGQSNGFPTYRLKWQKIGSIHRRFKGCMKNIRATPYKVGSDEFVALEAYLAYRGQGLPVETPAVRN